MDRADSATVQVEVEVAYSPKAGEVDLRPLQLPVGSTVQHALEASGLLACHGLTVPGLVVGVWGRVQPLDATLREQDRVEIYRPLLVDPKEARRQRYKRDGKKKSKAGSALRASADSPLV